MTRVVTRHWLPILLVCTAVLVLFGTFSLSFGGGDNGNTYTSTSIFSTSAALSTLTTTFSTTSYSTTILTATSRSPTTYYITLSETIAIGVATGTTQTTVYSTYFVTRYITAIVQPNPLVADVQIIGSVATIISVCLAAYVVWRKYFKGPDLKITNPYCRAISRSSGVLTSWNWNLTIRNDGSRDGEIRNFHVDIAEIVPNNLGLTLTLSLMARPVNGVYKKGKSVPVNITINYSRSGLAAQGKQAQVTKLIARLAWEKEARQGFAPDNLTLQLLP